MGNLLRGIGLACVGLIFTQIIAHTVGDPFPWWASVINSALLVGALYFMLLHMRGENG